MAKEKKVETFDKSAISKNTLNSLMNGYKDDVYNHINEKPVRFSSGSLILDSILTSNGSSGFQSSQVCRLGGNFAAGKTSQALLLISNYMNAMPNSKAIYVKAEGRLSEDIQKRTGLKFVFSADEWVTGSIFVLETNQFEVMADILENLLKTMFQNGERLACIIDSLDGLILSNDLKDKDIKEGTMVAGVPKLTKLFFRRMALPIGKFNAFFVLISQASTQIQLSPYGPKDPPRAMNGSGGVSASHAADIILEYNPRYNGDLILQNPKEKPSLENKVLGHEVSIKIVKATNETDSMVCRIPIKRGRIGTPNSVWIEKEIVDYCLSFELIKKKGAWLSTDTALIEEAKKDNIEIKEQFHGLDEAYSYIEENKQIFNWLYSKFSKVLGQ